jgi:hypothetical protein
VKHNFYRQFKIPPNFLSVSIKPASTHAVEEHFNVLRANQGIEGKSFLTEYPNFQ